MIGVDEIQARIIDGPNLSRRLVGVPGRVRGTTWHAIERGESGADPQVALVHPDRAVSVERTLAEVPFCVLLENDV